MKVVPVKTRPIVPGDELFKIFYRYISSVENKSVVAVTSKIVAICEGRVEKIGSRDKDALIKEEADCYLPVKNKYNFHVSIKNNIITPSAGIDESNGNGFYILWPKDPQASANRIRAYLQKRFGLKNLGVVITDSKTTPLRWGVTGVAVAHSGFEALNNYVGTKDIFGRRFKVEKVNVADALAASAVLVMGEGKEQTPLAIIEDVPFVKFQNRDPSKKELEGLTISLEDDLYGQLLTSVKWAKGKNKP